MQNQTQIRICESANLSLARAVYSAQITIPVQATQGEISDNSLISLKTVASGALKHLRALGLAQATPMRAGAPTYRTPSLVAAAATQILEHVAKCDQIDVGWDPVTTVRAAYAHATDERWEDGLDRTPLFVNHDCENHVGLHNIA